jgi:hypothetical protein
MSLAIVKQQMATITRYASKFYKAFVRQLWSVIYSLRRHPLLTVDCSHAKEQEPEKPGSFT